MLQKYTPVFFFVLSGPPRHRDFQKRPVLEPWVHRYRKTEIRFFRKQGRKRPQLVVEDSNLTATSAFPALAIPRPYNSALIRLQGVLASAGFGQFLWLTATQTWACHRAKSSPKPRFHRDIAPSGQNKFTGTLVHASSPNSLLGA
jgi:hypothetical protein